MQPFRRHENFNRQQQPPASKYRFESGIANPHSSSRRRPEVHRTIKRRSLSPQDDHMGIASIERKENYGLHLGVGAGQGRRSRSRSPILPLIKLRKGSHFEEDLDLNFSPPPPLPVPAPVPMEFKRRREAGNYSVSDDLDTKQVYVSEYDDFGISKEVSNDGRLPVGGSKHRALSQKSIHMEDGAVTRSKSVFIDGDAKEGEYQSPPSLGPIITQGGIRGRQPSSSARSMSLRHSEQERLHYQNPISLNRVPVIETNTEAKFPTRDGFYSMMSRSHSNDVFPSSSTRLRNEFKDSFQHDQHILSLEEFSRSRKLTDSMHMNAYKERPIDYSRDPDSEQRKQTFYQRGSPTRVDQDDDDYFYPKSRRLTFDERELPCDQLHKVRHRQVRLDSGHSLMDFDHGTFSRSRNMLPVVDGNGNTENYSGNSRKSIMLNNSTVQRKTPSDYSDKKTPSDYSDISRISGASKQGGEHLNKGCMPGKFGRRMSQDYEISHLGASQSSQISLLKDDYGYEREADLNFQGRQPPVSSYDSEMLRNTTKMQSLRGDNLGLYETADRVLKRKYVSDDYGSNHNPRATVSVKWNTSREFQDLHHSGEEWDDQDIGPLYTTGSARSGHNEYDMPERKYAEVDHFDEFSSDDWLRSRDSLAQAQRNSVRYYKHDDRYANDHQKYGSLSRHKSQHVDIKSGFHKQHRGCWKKNDKYLENVYRNNDDEADPSENGVSSAAPEPSEDSEEFMQLVHEAFLTYSKQLNMHPGVRRRYMEQGKAGTLFCIVCGRSFSKEFMDTQRLVTHAFMSRKAGLRAQHLGLLKAVCALLGWSTVIPTDIVLWVPHALPKAEALAQKEDLVLWPPVIIFQNISMSGNNPENWKVVSIEALEAFLRGKGLISGRIKMCLGKPADQSVLLVKFLGTFTGFANAEKIHKYFAEQNRGRADVERVMSNNGNVMEAGMQDSVEERFMYGYMGIVEDLDKVDFNTRNWSLIKSKKEIQDLANAPVKP